MSAADASQARATPKPVTNINSAAAAVAAAAGKTAAAVAGKTATRRATNCFDRFSFREVGGTQRAPDINTTLPRTRSKNSYMTADAA